MSGEYGIAGNLAEPHMPVNEGRINVQSRHKRNKELSEMRCCTGDPGLLQDFQ